MCRFLMFQSRHEVPLAAFLKDAPHALVQQAAAPKEMHPNLPSADGWGVAWYAEGMAEPGAYRTVLPMWRDSNLGTLTPHLHASHFIAATRVATGNAELAITNVQPFTKDCISFAHNGVLEDFENPFLAAVRRQMSEVGQSIPRGVTDSAHLFALLLDALPISAGLGPAVDRLIVTVAKLCRESGKAATLNLLLSDGREAVAARYASPGKTAPSLYWRQGGHDILVASERLDEDVRWQAIKANTRMSFVAGALASKETVG